MFMEEKASLRNINFKKLNKALYAVILVVGLVYWEEILWSAFSLKEWMNIGIEPPADQILNIAAKTEMERDAKNDAILVKLNASLAINPVGEAVFLLGEYYFGKNEDKNALAQYEKAIRIDPSLADAYLRMASIHERNGKTAESRKILEKGITFFNETAPKFVPRPLEDAPWQSNVKAQARHEELLKAAKDLKDALRKAKRSL